MYRYSEGVLVNNFVLGGKPRRLDLHFNEVDSDGLPSLNVRSGVIFRRKVKLFFKKFNLNEQIVKNGVLENYLL